VPWCREVLTTFSCDPRRRWRHGSAVFGAVRLIP